MNRGVVLVFLVVLALFLAGCAAVDYCHLAPAARCDLEVKLEHKINAGLDAIDSDAKVDVVIDCPNDDVRCGDPEFKRSEAGDWRVIEAVVDDP